MKNLPKRVAAFAAALIGVVGFAPSTVADTFTPENDPPTVTLVSYPTSMQPANPRSTIDYTVSATIGSQGTLSNLSSVTMCFFEAGFGTQDCTNAGSEPKYEFKMTWTQSSNSFSVTGSNNYRNSGSSTSYGDGTGLSMDIDFTFKISNAMIAGNSWNVYIEAIDDQGNDSADPAFSIWNDPLGTGITVEYFGAVTTSRSSQSFGQIGYLGSSTIDDISTGSLLANGLSTVSLTATDFTNGLNTIDLSASSPMSGEVQMLCNSGSTFDDGIAYSIGNSAVGIDNFLFSSGTGETADTSHKHSCDLTFGGGAPAANIQYSNTVTVSIGAF